MRQLSMKNWVLALRSGPAVAMETGLRVRPQPRLFLCGYKQVTSLCCAVLNCEVGVTVVQSCPEDKMSCYV